MESGQLQHPALILISIFMIRAISSFPVFNNTVINSAGASELDALIDMIFTKSQVVSEYICRRLYRYFIYYDIDSTIESNIIIPLARTFVANNWEIEPVLNQLFKSQHFMIWPIEVFISNPLIWSLVVCVLLT
jgi:uncharacterized protein (DUF1800 family)